MSIWCVSLSIEYQSNVSFLRDIVPRDQWFVTHIDTSWTVKKTKQWLLGRCLPDNVHISRAFRPASRAAVVDHTQDKKSEDLDHGDTEFGDALLHEVEEEEYDEHLERHPTNRLGYDEEDIGSILELASTFGDELDDETTSISRGPRLIGERSKAERNRNSALLKGVQKELCALTSPWALYTFSDGHRLEDREFLKSYNITSHSLLEIHRVGAYVQLPRNEDYILPFYREDVIVAWIQGQCWPSTLSPVYYADENNTPNTFGPSINQKWRWATVRIADGHLEIYELGAGWGYGCASSDAAFKVRDQTGSFQRNYPFHSPWEPVPASNLSDFVEQGTLERKLLLQLRLDQLVELGDGPGRTQAWNDFAASNYKVVFARFVESRVHGPVQGHTLEADIAFAFPVPADGEGRDTGEYLICERFSN
jgi:hypothetical protein